MLHQQPLDILRAHDLNQNVGFFNVHRRAYCELSCTYQNLICGFHRLGVLIMELRLVTQPCIYLHCEGGLFNLTEPVDTQWHELWPFFCKQYHLSSWNDTSGDGVLSYCDRIDMYEKPDGEVRPYHVENVTITLFVTPMERGEPMYIELEGGFNASVLTAPWGTQWHEIYPVFCAEYELRRWEDNRSGVLDFCDYIWLLHKQTEVMTEWHVEEVAIDIIVTPEPPPVGGEAYPVNKISLLAPWIAVAVLLAGGISWLTLRRRRTQS